MVAAAAMAVSVGLGMWTVSARAEERTLASSGNIVYREDGREVAFYMEDLSLLRDKISTIPADVFAPGRYANARRQKDRRVNRENPVQYYEICDSEYDRICSHTAVREEETTITWHGKNYPGRRYTCDCGYQWVSEVSHTIVYDAVDSDSHRSRCELDGTEFCKGYEPVTEEHCDYRYEICQDGIHHRKICVDCGYCIAEEACSFTVNVEAGGEDDRDPSLLYCECGNGKRPEEVGHEPAAGEEGETEEPETSQESETPEESSADRQPSEEKTEEPSEETGPSGQPEEEPGVSEEPAEEPEMPEDQTAVEEPADLSEESLESGAAAGTERTKME